MHVQSSFYVWGRIDAPDHNSIVESVPVKCNRHELRHDAIAFKLLNSQGSSWCRCLVIDDGQLCKVSYDSDVQDSLFVGSINLVPCQQDGTYCEYASGGWSHTISAATGSSVIYVRDHVDLLHVWKTPRKVKQLAAGQYHCLILDEAGFVHVLGKGTSGQLGLGNGCTEVAAPVEVPGLGFDASQGVGLKTTQENEVHVKAEGCSNKHQLIAVQVCCGLRHSCVISSCGQVLTWGWGGLGQLGHGFQDDAWTPQVVTCLGGLHMKQAVGGAGHTLALSDSGDVYVSGWNNHGQLGLGEEHRDKGCTSFKLIDALTEDIVKVSAGAYHSLLVTAAGDLLTCGDNSSGQLGLGHTQDVYTPARVSFMKPLHDAGNPSTTATGERPQVHFEPPDVQLLANTPSRSRVIDAEGGWCHSVAVVEFVS